MRGHVGALAGGMIASLGFAPYAFRPALWGGLLLFFCTLDSGSAKTAAKRGGLFGLGYFGFGTYWVYYSAYTYASTPLWLATSLAAILAVYLSLYPALAAWLAARILPEGAQRLTGAAVFLSVMEWVRGTVFSGFPWILIGQGTLDSSWAGFLPLVGVYASGLLLMLAVAWTVVWLRQPSFGHVVWLGMAASILAVGETLKSVSWSTPVGEPVKVALVQPNLSQDLRWKAENLDRIKKSYRDLTERVSQTPLIIWPEAAIPQYYSELSSFYKDIIINVLSEESTLVSGVFYYGKDPEGPRNGLINTKTGQRYGKRRLVPFGEYTPMPDWLGPLYQRMSIRMRSQIPSNGRPLLQIHGSSVGVMICYESVYPEIARLAFPEAAYLINVSNDAWFGETRAPWQHLESNRLRAAETGRELLRVASTGVTAIIGANGSVKVLVPQFTVAILEGEVQPRVGITPYVLFGEWGFFALSALILLACLGDRKSRAREQSAGRFWRGGRRKS